MIKRFCDQCGREIVRDRFVDEDYKTVCEALRGSVAEDVKWAIGACRPPRPVITVEQAAKMENPLPPAEGL